MEKYRVEAGSCSVIGSRNSQQDALRFAQKGETFLAVVCDGMGGMSGGERASKEAVNIIFDLFENDFEEDEAQFTRWLNLAFLRADEAVSRLADREGNVLHAGSTVIAVLIRENRLYWASAGDSIIYYLNEQGLHTLTRMHNYNLKLEQMINDGEMTVQQARAEGENGRGEALISFLGIGGLPIIDSASRPLFMQSSDVVILASDGLYKSLSVPQIQAIVRESGGNMTIAAKRLCDEACRLAESKQDNTTVIAVKCCD